MTNGWFLEPVEHGMAARGISLGRNDSKGKFKNLKTKFNAKDSPRKDLPDSKVKEHIALQRKAMFAPNSFSKKDVKKRNELENELSNYSHEEIKKSYKKHGVDDVLFR